MPRYVRIKEDAPDVFYQKYQSEIYHGSPKYHYWKLLIQLRNELLEVDNFDGEFYDLIYEKTPKGSKIIVLAKEYVEEIATEFEWANDFESLEDVIKAAKKWLIYGKAIKIVPVTGKYLLYVSRDNFERNDKIAIDKGQLVW